MKLMSIIDYLPKKSVRAAATVAFPTATTAVASGRIGRATPGLCPGGTGAAAAAPGSGTPYQPIPGIQGGGKHHHSHNHIGPHTRLRRLRASALSGLFIFTPQILFATYPGTAKFAATPFGHRGRFRLGGIFFPARNLRPGTPLVRFVKHVSIEGEHSSLLLTAARGDRAQPSSRASSQPPHSH